MPTRCPTTNASRVRSARLPPRGAGVWTSWRWPSSSPIHSSTWRSRAPSRPRSSPRTRPRSTSPSTTTPGRCSGASPSPPSATGRRGRSSPGAEGSARRPRAPERAPEQHEGGDPEDVRADGGAEHEPVEAAGERKGNHEEVPVASRERREHAVEHAVLPAAGAAAAALGVLAPADHRERREDAEPEEREDGTAGEAGTMQEPERETAEDGEMHDRVSRHVEPVTEARLGEPQA